MSRNTLPSSAPFSACVRTKKSAPIGALFLVRTQAEKGALDGRVFLDKYTPLPYNETMYLCLILFV